MGVYDSIIGVMTDLNLIGIEKSKKNNHQGYMYRGIDQLYQALCPALIKNKLTIIPKDVRIKHEGFVETKSGTSRLMVVSVDYLLKCEDDELGITFTGEAMDSGDKALNKAVTAAYKYLCFQLFCIPVEGNEDADASTHELVRAEESKPKEELKKIESKSAASKVIDLNDFGVSVIKALIGEIRKIEPGFKTDLSPEVVKAMTNSEFEKTKAELEKRLNDVRNFIGQQEQYQSEED